MISKNSALVIEIFKEIDSVPRCSKNEDKIADYLIDFAGKAGLSSKKDSFNNVVIKVPAAEGYEDKPSVVIQGHMDMVCEKTVDSDHDFSKDPIDIIVDNDWMRAEETTLGADDGIALAIGLALAADKKIEHPELELLFTSDEETGLNGAKNIEDGFFKSKKLINIDSEDEGVFIVGCAGGEDTEITLPLKFKNSDKEMLSYEIIISGLLSGHSGIDINKNRANAIKLMTKLLKKLKNRFDVKLSFIEGGSARNAIPGFCRSIVYCSEPEKEMKQEISGFLKEQRNKYNTEKDMAIELKNINNTEKVIESRDFSNLIDLLDELPHGADSVLNNKTVEISNNLAKVSIAGNILTVSTSQRSQYEAGLDEITQKIEYIAQTHGASYESCNRYPSWQPKYNSYILQKSIEIYEMLFFEKPKIEVIHAGLECGILGSKSENIDMISIGPTIKNPHTPNERVYIPSIEKIWSLVTELLKNI